MNIYKSVEFEGQEYSVPVDFKYISKDSDGEVTAWKNKPELYFQDSKGINGFWTKGGESANLDLGGLFDPDWKLSLYMI